MKTRYNCLDPLIFVAATRESAGGLTVPNCGALTRRRYSLNGRALIAGAHPDIVLIAPERL